MKLLIALMASLALVACSDPSQWKSEPIVMTVVELQDSSSAWGCIGTNVKTLLRSDDGRVAHVCSGLGKPGDKVRGCWISGHKETFNDSALANGFRTICE